MRGYITIERESVAELVIKHSRFIATACPIDDYDEGIAKVAALKSKYSNATHNCYAFVAIPDASQKYSDDGEPQGTAGQPILEVIRKRGLSHVLVVVTRYFGGIKLGAGGLVSAYTQAACMALDNAVTMKMSPCRKAEITTDYYTGGKLASVVAGVNGKTLSVAYEDGVCATVVVPQDSTDKLEKAVTELTKGKGEVRWQEELLYRLDA